VNDAGFVARPVRSSPFADSSFIRLSKEETTMKSLFKLALSLGLTALGLFGLQGSAMALVALNANICQSTDPGPGIIRSGGFIQNAAANSRVVICPVIRIGEVPVSGWSVFVDGNAPAPTPAGGTLRCQLESYNFTNQFLGAVSFTVDAAGNFDRLLTLPKALVPTFSHQALFCSLPPGGSIFDIEPTTP
jgi:hypothetical protein